MCFLWGPEETWPKPAPALLRVAREVASAVLPCYRSRLSKHPFSQTQWLAALCRMRYQNGTFRATAVCLREHRELRRWVQLGSAPDDTTLCRFLKRLDNQRIDPALGEAARCLETGGRRRPASVAVKATAPSPLARPDL